MSSIKPKRNFQNYCLALVISIIIVCIVLMVIARTLVPENNDSKTVSNNNRSDQIRAGKSDYPVKTFIQAAEELTIETINHWIDYSGDAYYTIWLPQRLQPLSDEDLLAVATPTASHLEKIIILALDAESTTNGVNLTITRSIVGNEPRADEYIIGVAEEMRANQFTVEDVSAYSLGGRLTGRVIYSQDSPNAGPLTGVQFVFTEPGTLWLITGTSISTDFENWLPIFQAITRELTTIWS